MRESTRSMLKTHGLRIDRFLHNYIYFVFYYPYVKAMLLLFRFLAFALSWFKPLNIIISMAFARYHSKIISFGDVTKILTLNEDVMATSEKNKRIIPFDHAYKVILKDADQVAVMDCPCLIAKKGKNLGDCGPLNRCIAIGKGVSSFWVEHCEKYNARFISQQQAIELIKDFRKRGHITQAFFKVATGGKTGIFCNCCPDCCVSLEATKLAKKFKSSFSMNAQSGYSVAHNPEICTGCGTCSSICHFDAISYKEGSAKYYRSGDCMGCGLCMEHCPSGALSLYIDKDKPLPLDIDIVRKEFID